MILGKLGPWRSAGLEVSAHIFERSEQDACGQGCEYAVGNRDDTAERFSALCVRKKTSCVRDGGPLELVLEGRRSTRYSGLPNSKGGAQMMRIAGSVKCHREQLKARLAVAAALFRLRFLTRQLASMDPRY